MKKSIILFVALLLLISISPSFAASPEPSTVKMTVVLKNDNIPEHLKTTIFKNGGQVISELTQVGALEIKGPATLIPLLQLEDSVHAVSSAIKIPLAETNVVPFDKSKHMRTFTDKMSVEKKDSTRPAVEDNFPVYHHYFQWDIKRVTNNGESYKVQKGNHDVIVGIIDTGVDINHPDLQKNLLGGRNYVPAGGIDGNDSTETGDPGDYSDRNGHGTHVAGTIAGNGMIYGVAPEAGFRAYRVFGAEGEASSATIAKAIIGAVDDNVDVISMSVGGFSIKGQTWWNDTNTGKTYKLGNDVADYVLYKRSLKYAADHGVIVVAASGNDNLNVTNKSDVTKFLNKEYGPQGYKFVGAGFEVPGSIPGVITVSATGPEDIRASYSNYGAGFVDVTAPGGDFERQPNSSWFEDMNFSAYKNQGYAWMAGTSMATPKVSAVAALIIAQEGKMSPDKLAKKIKETADDIGKQKTDRFFGNGMVQAPNNPVKLDPTVDWQKTFGGIGVDEGSVVHQTKDSGYILVGNTYSFASGGDDDRDIYVVKTNDEGKIEWRTILGGKEKEYGHAVEETSDGGYLVVGNTQSFGEGDSNLYIIKLNRDGSRQWEKTIGNSNTDGTSIVKAENNSYVIAGYQNNDVYLVKIDEQGEMVWEKNFGGTASDFANTVRSTADGGYIIGGETFSNNGLENKKDFYLIKVSKDGEKEWEKMYGDQEIYDSVNDIQQTNNGEFMIVGTKIKRVWNGGYFPQEIPDIYYAKIDSEGELLWEKTFGQEETYEEAYSIEKTLDGNYVISGSKEVSDETKDVFLMKFDENGNTLFEKQYGGTESDFGTHAEQTMDGGYIVIGNTKSYSIGFTGSDRDIYLVKLNKGIN